MKKLMRAASCGLVIAMLCLVSTTRARAQNDKLDFHTDKVLIGVGVGVAAAVIVTVVVLHHQHGGQRTITGCVAPGPNGIGLKNDKDQQLYPLVGDTAGVVPGQRMTLQVRKIKGGDQGRSVTWQKKKIVGDLGACPT